MLKTLLATSAAASLLAWGALAQDAPAAGIEESTPPAIGVDQDPAVQNSDPTILPEASDAQAADPAGTMAADPVAPGAAKPADGMAAEPAAPGAAEPADTMAADPSAPGVVGPPMEEGWTQVDVATISADSLIGSDIRTYDQENVASVEDVLLDPDGKVDNVVARFGGFLGFGETTVLLKMDEITVVKDADDRMFVLTSLTPEGLKDRPEYTPEEG